MQNIKELAISLFNLENPLPSKSGGAHEISLDSGRKWDELPEQMPDGDTPLAKYVDHTLLKAEATKADVANLCKEANTYQFKSICINPSMVKAAKYHLEGPLLCTVVGFPLGTHETSIKVAETRLAIEQGAQEIDMVINIGALKAKEYDLVLADIAAVADVCHQAKIILKTIIETALLNKTEKIIACLIAKKAGSDFVKTSTGLSSAGATVEDIELMRQIVGPKVGVKASGGVRNRADALKMLQAGANRIGTSSGIIIVEG